MVLTHQNILKKLVGVPAVKVHDKNVDMNSISESENDT